LAISDNENTVSGKKDVKRGTWRLTVYNIDVLSAALQVRFLSSVLLLDKLIAKRRIAIVSCPSVCNAHVLLTNKK